MASVHCKLAIFAQVKTMFDEKIKTYLIHCGSLVTVSPGTTIPVPNPEAWPRRGRLICNLSMSTSPSESCASKSRSVYCEAAFSTAGARIVMPMAR